MKIQPPDKSGFLPVIANLAALIIAALLFAASFPNPLFTNGLPFLAWIAYLPVFFVVRRSGFGFSIFYGAFYGYAAYGFFNYWLSVFHPLAGLIVGSIYLVYMALLFPLMRLAVLLFPRRGYILQFLLWMAYEYLRTQGFLGYSYGIAGYSQWNIPPVIQIADIAGVWGVTALVVFPSAWLAAALDGRTAGKSAAGKNPLLGLKSFFRKERVSAVFWFVLLAFSLIYGFTSQVDYSGERKVKVALIQHNTDPWQPSKAPTMALSFREYRNDFRILSRLSDEALAAHPDTDIVVWSETAFVPRIHWHTTIRDDPLAWELVRELLAYLGRQRVPFVIGNDDARKEPSLNPNTSESNRVDYNAVMLYERGEMTGIYRKLHMVPFTENFPYGEQFPWIYNALKEADTHFWEKGTEATVFEVDGIKFSTPICFEDTFGYLSRDFVRNGAELIVNLSNDAWSKSLSAQMQHLSMAVFRAVENRRSMVRSTASGQTCAVDPNGRIIAMAEPFTEAWLSAEVPLMTASAFYTKHGDYLGRFFCLAAFVMLLSGLVACTIKRLSYKKHEANEKQGEV